MTIPVRAIALALMIHCLWGANPIAVKLGLAAFPALWSAFIRFSLGIVCIALWARFNGIALWPRANEWPTLILISVVFTVQIATMNWGIDLTSASMASILISTNPLFAAAFVHLLIPNDRLTGAKVIGLTIAFAGTALTLTQGASGENEHFAPLGNAIMLFSAALLGLRLSVSAKSVQKIEPAKVLFWQMLLGLPVFAAGGFGFETIQWANVDLSVVLGLAYQGIVIAGLCFMLMTYLMRRYPPSVIVSFNFASPVVGVLLGVVLLDEPFNGQIALGMTAVGLGLYLITTAPTGPTGIKRRAA